jgi:hypothetical protein
MNHRPNLPKVLIPFNLAEAVTVPEAAKLVGRSAVTVRTWCSLYDLGRRVAGQWWVSRVALAMFLDSDRDALRAYLSGDRASELVASYFDRCGVAR